MSPNPTALMRRLGRFTCPPVLANESGTTLYRFMSGLLLYSLMCAGALANPSDAVKPLVQQCSNPEVRQIPPQARAQPRTLTLGTPSQRAPKIAQTGNIPTHVYERNPTLMSAAPGDELTFQTPDGKVHTVPLTSVRITRNCNTELTGSAGDTSIFGVVNANGDFFAAISTPEGRFEAQISGGETLVYAQSEGAIAPEPFAEDAVLAAVAQQSSEPAPTAESTTALSANPTVLSVGILYDDTIAGLEDSAGLTAMADFYTGVANTSYQAAGLDVVFDVVAIGNYNPHLSTSSMSETLRWITCGTTTCNSFDLNSSNTTVSTWRDTNKADLVAQFVQLGTWGGTCGIAWVNNQSFVLNTRDYLLRATYSVNARKLPGGSSCPSIVLAHEMGHNLTLLHDRITDTGQITPLYSYGYGYKQLSPEFGTVMSYTSNYVQTLSNPNVTHQGYPAGVPIGQPDEAHASEAVANVMSYYEALYDNPVTPQATIPPQPTITRWDYGDGEIYLLISVTVDNEASAITEYAASCTDGSQTFQGTSSSSYVTVSGLTNGVAYTCTATATNTAGTSPESSVTPAITPEESVSGLPIWLLYEATKQP